jgi:hypothetical protein
VSATEALERIEQIARAGANDARSIGHPVVERAWLDVIRIIDQAGDPS